MEDIEKYLIDVVLAARGSLQFSDIKYMTSAHVSMFVERIDVKNKAEAGVKGKEYL